MPPEQQAINKREGSSSADSPGEAAAAGLARAAERLAGKEAALQALSEELSAAEQALLAERQPFVGELPAGLAAGGSQEGGAVLAARWRCLAERRAELAARWQCLLEEKRQLGGMLRTAHGG